jgi:succinate dehydrogenase/fumarate reductase-like Fe-S protein
MPGSPVIRDLVNGTTNLYAYRIFRCRIIVNCAGVCLKGLEPSHAIKKIRLMMAKLLPDRVGLPTRRHNSAQ